jgi:hypothetical protein
LCRCDPWWLQVTMHNVVSILPRNVPWLRIMSKFYWPTSMKLAGTCMFSIDQSTHLPFNLLDVMAECLCSGYFFCSRKKQVMKFSIPSIFPYRTLCIDIQI